MSTVIIALSCVGRNFYFLLPPCWLKLGSKKRSSGCWNMTAGICSYSDTRASGIDVGDEVWPTSLSNSSQMCSWGSGLVFVRVSQVLPQQRQSNISIQISLCAQEKRPFSSVYCEIWSKMSLHALALRFSFTVITRLHKTF